MSDYDRQSRGLPEGSLWSRLTDQEKGFLFDRLAARIESRAAEASEWRRFCGKALVACNATAAAATLAFVASISAKRSDQAVPVIVRDSGYAACSFVLGFILSMIFIMIVYARSRETLVAESEYLNDVVRGSAPINWHENPRIHQLGLGKFLAAAWVGGFALTFFVVGAAMVLRVLLWGT